MKIKIFGAGTWGTALAELLVQNGHEVSVWHYKSEFIQLINKSLIHPNLGSHRLSKKIHFTTSVIYDKKTRSRSSNLLGLAIRIVIILMIFAGIVFLLNKINFPTPNKVIEKIIPNENFKIVK